MKTPIRRTGHSHHRGAVASGIARTLVWSALFAAMLTGCASNPPVAALSAAEAEISAATKARAAHNAPTELERANRLLDAARVALDERRYDDAERLSERAQVEAELARARSGLVGIREQVERKQAENFDLRRRLMATEQGR